MADSELACVHAYLAPIPEPAPLKNIALFDPQGGPVRSNPHLKPEAIDSDIQI